MTTRPPVGIRRHPELTPGLNPGLTGTAASMAQVKAASGEPALTGEASGCSARPCPSVALRIRVRLGGPVLVGLTLGIGADLLRERVPLGRRLVERRLRVLARERRGDRPGEAFLVGEG